MRHLIREFENSDIYRSWLNFVNSGQLTAHVKPIIAASWQRCRAIGLDPRGNNFPDPLSPQELDNLMTRSLPLLEASRGSLEILEKALDKIPFVILLSDAQGNIIFQIASGHVGKYFEQVGIITGGKDREDVLGTTALGLTLVEQKPVIVHREEHYSEIFHWLCCTSAPIFDIGGHLAGGINIAISEEEAPKIPLLFGLSLSTVKCIQAELNTSQFLAKINETLGLTDSIVNCMDNGVIVCDSIGKIVHANRRAGDILQVPTQQMISKHYYEFIESELLTTCHSTRAKAEGKVIVLNGRNERVKCLVKVNPLHDHSGRLLGSIAVLEEDKKKWPVRKEGASSTSFCLNDVVGESLEMKRAVMLAQRFGVSDVPIMLYGETGTGKELFAHAIHNLSYRKNGPFVPLNCAAIPSGLVESEFFGYTRGAFTGAAREGKKGKFEVASGGTLFLDEIDSMPLELQAKLLRAIESNKIELLGDNISRCVDVRIITAMGGGLESNRPDSGLRKDLFYRLSSVRIFLPPLRSRIEDIEPLAHVFLKQSAQKYQRAIRKIDPAAMAILKAHDWPGNIRELKSVIEFAVCISDSEIILPENLPDHICAKIRDQQDSSPAITTVLGDMEKRVIEKILDEKHGSRRLAAQAMGLSRTTFYRRCKKHNILAHVKS